MHTMNSDTPLFQEIQGVLQERKKQGSEFIPEVSPEARVVAMRINALCINQAGLNPDTRDAQMRSTLWNEFYWNAVKLFPEEVSEMVRDIVFEIEGKNPQNIFYNPKPGIFSSQGAKVIFHPASDGSEGEVVNA